MGLLSAIGRELRARQINVATIIARCGSDHPLFPGDIAGGRCPIPDCPTPELFPEKPPLPIDEDPQGPPTRLLARIRHRGGRPSRGVGFQYLPRSSWTSSSPGGSPIPVKRMNTYLHHTAGPKPEGGEKATLAVEQALIRETRTFHIRYRAMSDIAYSFGVMPSGRCYGLRGPGRSGGHTLNHNEDGYGVVYFGNFDTSSPGKASIDAGQHFFDFAKHRGWLGGERDHHPTRGHRDVSDTGTACPGSNLYNRMDELRTPAPHHHHPHGDEPHPPGRRHHHGRRRNRVGTGEGTGSGGLHPHTHRHRPNGPLHEG